MPINFFDLLSQGSRKVREFSPEIVKLAKGFMGQPGQSLPGTTEGFGEALAYSPPGALALGAIKAPKMAAKLLKTLPSVDRTQLSGKALSIPSTLLKKAYSGETKPIVDYIDAQKIFARKAYRNWQTSLMSEELKPARTTTQLPKTTITEVDSLKDIGNLASGFRDVFRNFKAVYGPKFNEVKKTILDPFDVSKGKFIDDQQHWLKSLDENVIKLGIKKGSRESELIQLFGEKKISLDQLQTIAPKKWDKIVEANKWFRNAYDTLLNEVNAVRKQIYPNNPDKIIPHRQDYYRHFREVAQGVQGLQNIFETPANIQSSLAGVSEFTKPKAKWLSFAQRRTGEMTDIDAVGGFLNYLKSATYAKNIDPHVEKFRGLAEQLAAQTDLNTPNAGKLNNFIEFLHDFTNDLSGKTNPWDRTTQKWIPGGRKTFRALNWLNTRVKNNVILGNLSSSVAQAFNIPQGIASAGLVNATKGLGRSLVSMFSSSSPVKQSTFLKERYFNAYNKFDEGMLKNPKRFAVWITQALDEVGSKYIWQSHYAKAISSKIADPVKYADDFTRNMVAGRGVGEAPLAQKSKLFQLVAPFQLEVGNLWWVMKDFVDEKAFGKIATLFTMNYLFNRAAEQVRGSAVTFDPIQATISALGELDEEQGLLKAGGRLAGEVLSNIPVGQSIATVYPEYGAGEGTPTRKELFGRSDPTRFGSGLLVAKGLQDPLTKIALPFGGQQIQKTGQAVSNFLKGGSYTKKDELRFPIPTEGLGPLQSLLFGQYATKEAREYFNENRRPLSEEQTKQVEAGRSYDDVQIEREIKSLKSKIKKIASDPKLSERQKDKKIEKLEIQLERRLKLLGE